MTGDAEARNRANAYLAKALEYLASAQDSLAAGRVTAAAGDAIHAGISAKDAVTTTLTGTTVKNKNHGLAVRELRTALGQREEAARASKAFAELIAMKAEVEYGTKLISLDKAESLVRRAHVLVDLAIAVVRLGR